MGITIVKTREQLLKDLRLLSKSKGMTRISEETKINRGYLYSILSKSGNPTVESLIKICDALGIRIELKPEPK